MICLGAGHGKSTASPTACLAALAVGLILFVGLDPFGCRAASAAPAPGSVWVWGLDLSRLGEPTPPGSRGTTPIYLLTSPARVAGPDNVTAVAVGGGHALALKGDGSVWAWGDNYQGQLGNGDYGYSKRSSSPIRVENLNSITAVAAAENYNLALQDDGTLWGWGSQTTRPATRKLVPVRVGGISEVVAISVGTGRSLALKSDGTVWILSIPAERSIPTRVPNLTGVTAVAQGYTHRLALRSDGTVWAWGYNTFGQLGNLATADSESTVPVQVKDLSRVTAVAAGTWHSLALTSDGRVWAWGANGSGQLGNGLRQDMTIPVEVMGLTAVVAIAGGGGRLGEERGLGDRVSGHSLALKADGTVWAWGGGSMGELGNGASGDGTYSAVPVQVSGLSGVSAISAGTNFNLALIPVIPPTLSPSPAPRLPQSPSPPPPTPPPSPVSWPSSTEQYLFIIIIVILIAAFIIIYTRVRR